MTTDTQIRLECLRLVLEVSGDKLADDTVILVAGKFADFVLQDRRPETATGNGG